MMQSSLSPKTLVEAPASPLEEAALAMSGGNDAERGPGPIALAMADIASGVRNYYLWGLLGWLDIKQRYRRSALGPFWLTISMGVTVSALGVLYSLLFKVKTQDLLPWVTSGFIVWGLISGTLVEACHCFILSEGVIKQVQIPLSLQPLRVLWRNLIMMAHNILILPVVYLIYQIVPTNALWLALPGMALLLFNLAWFSLLLGMICTRFRDLPQLVNSILQIAFYVTPIIWQPSLLPAEGATILMLNPFYHVMVLVRDPLLGNSPPLLSWAVSGGMALLGALLTLVIYGRFHRRVAYWL